MQHNQNTKLHRRHDSEQIIKRYKKSLSNLLDPTSQKKTHHLLIKDTDKKSKHHSDYNIISNNTSYVQKKPISKMKQLNNTMSQPLWYLEKKQMPYS